MKVTIVGGLTSANSVACCLWLSGKGAGVLARCRWDVSPGVPSLRELPKHPWARPCHTAKVDAHVLVEERGQDSVDGPAFQGQGRC